MANASNAVAADKGEIKAGTEKVSEKAAVKVADKIQDEKLHDKVAEKRRALGRGLASLLPGPRVVTPNTPATAVAGNTSPRDVNPGNAGLGRVNADAVTVEPAQADRSTSASETPAGTAATFASSSSSATSSSSAPASSLPSSSFPSSFPSSPSLSALSSASPSAAASVDLQASTGISGADTADGEHVIQLEIELIDDNPYQTRRHFDEGALNELANSIRTQGLMQPIVVRPGATGSKDEGRFTLILGERRLRASQLAGRTTIAAIVTRVSPQQAAEMTVVENLQRQDLNCIEQAEAFANLSQQFKLTQEQIGARVGMSRETVSNYMRLLSLTDGIVSALTKGQLTYSHARVLLMVTDTVQRWKLAQKVMEESMSVAKLQDMVLGRSVSSPSPGKKEEAGGARWVDPNVKAAQRTIEEILGMRVRVRDQHGRGKIVIEYDTVEDFDRVVRMLKDR